MAPAPHLDGHYTIFGELVDGQHVAAVINALAKGRPNNELLNSKDAQIVDAGEVRRGTHWSSAAFQDAVKQERERIAGKAAGAAR
jgi:cyclophilin family peptidyl-prolyl cis-trans isomerase